MMFAEFSKEMLDPMSNAMTHKKEFLAQINRLVPWDAWLALLRPHYYEGRRGQKPYPEAVMLRIFILQNLYDLSDMGLSDALLDSRAFDEFCGIERPEEVPDGDTIGRFRNLLIAHSIQEKIFKQVRDALENNGLILKKGTIVDSTIISAPTSIKNAEKTRDPDAHQVKKGNQWYHGFKAHVGVDKDSGIVHTVEVTPANTADVTQTPKLLHGEEETVHGDSGYTGAQKREDAVKTNQSGQEIDYKIAKRPKSYQNEDPQTAAQTKRREREKASVRAKVEHQFAVVKKQLGYRKTRYRGLKKQTAKLNIMFALSNLIISDRPSVQALRSA